MIHRSFVAGCVVLVACVAAWAAPPVSPSPATKPADAGSLVRFDYVQPKMGTVFHVVLYAPDKPTADAAATAAFARVDELNRTLSDYDPESELSKLARRTDAGPMPEPLPVSQDLFQILTDGKKAAGLSDGAFDVTVGPLTKLWRRSRDMKELPSPERLAAAKAAVGYRHMKLVPETRSVQLLASKMRLDVGGIAKGYTAGEAMKVLTAHGVTRAVVGAAGDIAIGDPPPGKADWRVGIQSLERPDDLAGYVHLHNAAISTSGDTYRYVEIDGKRYSHIIDPQTGLGLTEKIGVIVIAPDPTTSDWSSTAVSILGAEKGLALIERLPGCAVRIVLADAKANDAAGGANVRESSRFKDFHFEPAPAAKPATGRSSAPTTFPAPANPVE